MFKKKSPKRQDSAKPQAEPTNMQAQAKSRLQSVLGRSQPSQQDKLSKSFEQAAENTTNQDAYQLALLEKVILAQEPTNLTKEEIFERILRDSPIEIVDETIVVKNQVLSGSKVQDVQAQCEGQVQDELESNKHASDAQDRPSHTMLEQSECSTIKYPVVVYTPEELAKAQKSGAERILVKGQLASKLESALKAIRSMSASSLNALALVLSGAALLAPFTGGVSLGAAGTVMGTLGAAVTAAAIAAISAIGLSLVIAVIKGYEEVKIGGGGLELVIKKHHDKTNVKVNLSQESSSDKKTQA